ALAVLNASYLLHALDVVYYVVELEVVSHGHWKFPAAHGDCSAHLHVAADYPVADQFSPQRGLAELTVNVRCGVVEARRCDVRSESVPFDVLAVDVVIAHRDLLVDVRVRPAHERL